ncbi:CynX/NimT family MFS transporter [Chloroflexota bacterium]
MKEAANLQPAPETEPSQSNYRWVMLGLVWLAYCAFGLVSRSLAPLVTPVVEDLSISYSQMGIIMGSWPITYIPVSLVGGIILDRWGIRKSLFLGIFIIGLSAGLRYFASGFGTMFLFVAMFGLGGPMISVGAPKTISTWFAGRSRGTAVGIYMTAPWIGGLLALSLTNSVFMPLTGESWQLTMVIYGGIAILVALLLVTLARDVPATQTARTAGIVEVFKTLGRIPNVRLILLMGFLHFVVTHGFNNWLPKLLETGGLSPDIAGFAASIPTFVGIPVVLTLPRLLPPHLRGRAISAGSLALGIALVIVSLASGGALIAGLLLLGTCFAYIMPMLMLTLMDTSEVDTRYMGAAGGMFFCVAEIGGFVGPLLVGTLADMTGDFFWGMSFIAALSAGISLLALRLRS